MSLAASSSTHYGRVAVALHWLLALAILGTLGFGVYMTDLPMSPSRLRLYNYHKWAGITIFVLSAARLLWRLWHRPPEDVAMAAWQRRAAHATHWALYALFFAVPLSGWAHSSASGFPVVWFGVLPLPDLAPVDRPLAQTLKLVHNAFASLLAGLVLVHVAAALKHQLIDRDGLLRRMWPARS